LALLGAILFAPTPRSQAYSTPGAPEWQGAKNGLKLIQQFGAGLEGVDRAAAADLGVPVMNISTVEGNAVSTAELAVYLLLSILRRSNECGKVLDNRGLGSPVGATINGKRILVSSIEARSVKDGGTFQI
jgi:lactate dehydrogenase-like 2-hydroxyacid dehydrogenase